MYAPVCNIYPRKIIERPSDVNTYNALRFVSDFDNSGTSLSAKVLSLKIANSPPDALLGIVYYWAYERAAFKKLHLEYVLARQTFADLKNLL